MTFDGDKERTQTWVKTFSEMAKFCVAMAIPLFVIARSIIAFAFCFTQKNADNHINIGRGNYIETPRVWTCGHASLLSSVLVSLYSRSTQSGYREHSCKMCMVWGSELALSSQSLKYGTKYIPFSDGGATGSLKQ
jgi:hypothetical protein